MADIQALLVELEARVTALEARQQRQRQITKFSWLNWTKLRKRVIGLRGRSMDIGLISKREIGISFIIRSRFGLLLFSFPFSFFFFFSNQQHIKL